MSQKIKINIPKDHVSGGFKWAQKPDCKCGLFISAIEDQFIFVGDLVLDDSNCFYMIPLDSEGALYHRHEIPVKHCLWCGDLVKGRKAK